MKKIDGSWEQFDDYVLDFAVEQASLGFRFALVTLMRIEGASPRPLGAQMAVSETGQWVGYLSGGCIERAVVSEALDALHERKNRRVRYGRGSHYIDIQLPCGSAIELFFDVTQQLDNISRIDGALSDRRSADLSFNAILGDSGGEGLVVQNFRPRRRLVVAGVGPAAVQVCRVAAVSGFDVELISGDAPTRDYAMAAGCKTREILNPRKPPVIFADRRTAVVFMFHDHDLEREMLAPALATSAFYIGAMGSRATHRQRLDYLREQGFDDAACARIRGPAGLFAGSKSASDIALSILAEVALCESQALSAEAQDTLVEVADPRRRRPAAGQMTKHGETGRRRHAERNDN